MKNTSLAFSSVIWEVSCSSLRFPLGVSVKRCRGFQTSKTQSVDKSAGIFDGNSAFFHLPPHKQGGSENPKARRCAARVFFILWCGQLRSARNRRKIFTETSCALIVSSATIHHSMLCQLHLHSSSRYFCYSN
jgi:hypothetical protein